MLHEPSLCHSLASRITKSLILTFLVLLTIASANAATVKTDLGDYFPGQTVKVTGSVWLPTETVTLLFHEVPTLNPDITLYATADSSGNISATYKVEPEDAGVAYTLTATGNTSGLFAQTTFTDKPAA